MGTKFCISVFALTLTLLSAAEPEPHTAILNGYKIHYLSTGQGDEALVFIHGWTCNSTFWRTQAPVYESRRSLLVDLPGHGLSDKPEIPYTMELFARAVHAVMADAKVHKATLIGHSMGTPVAAASCSECIRTWSTIVMVDGFDPLPPKDEADRKKQLAQGAGTSKALRAADYRAFDKRIIESIPCSLQRPIRLLREEIGTQNDGCSAARYGFGNGWDECDCPRSPERYPQVPVELIC